MIDADTIYETLAGDDQKKIAALLNGLPENPMKSSLASILIPNDKRSVILAFGMLPPVYSQGANVKIGELLGLALYKVAKRQQTSLPSIDGPALN